MNNLFKPIDIRYLLIDNYKKIGLDENQLAVLLQIDNLLGQGNVLVTADQLALKMVLSIEEIDKILVSLINKNMLEYDNQGNQMKTTLEPLKKQLYRLFQIELLRKSEENAKEEFNEAVSNIYQIFEKEWSRTLTPLEFGRIREWISIGYSEQMIVDGLNEALASNKKSIRTIDKILLQKTSRDDIKKEGFSAVNEQWEKDIEKTIAIAQTKWLDDE